jgi:hypothetical protein
LDTWIRRSVEAAFRAVPNSRDAATRPVQLVQALCIADQEVALGILVELADDVPARDFLDRVGVVGETATRDIEAIEAVDGVDPHRAGPILVQGSDVVVSQALAVVRVVPVVREGIAGRVETVQPAVRGADPENAGAIFVENLHRVFAEAGRVAGVVTVVAERVAVVAVEAVIGAEPQKTVVVLCER